MYRRAQEYIFINAELLIDRKYKCQIQSANKGGVQAHCNHYDIMDINTDGDKIEYAECAVCCWCGEEQKDKIYATKLKHGIYNTDRT